MQYFTNLCGFASAMATVDEVGYTSPVAASTTISALLGHFGFLDYAVELCIKIQQN